MKVALLLAAISSSALAQVRVEPRALVKERHFFFSGGFTWLERNDDYLSPGATLAAAYYPREADGVELRAAIFASRLNSAGEEVFNATGLVPDAQKPRTLLLAGWRHSLTYGKVALASAVVHFDVQSGVFAGTLVAERGGEPAAALSAGLLARVGSRAFLQLEFALVGSVEKRSTTVFALGALPVLALGWSL